MVDAVAMLPLSISATVYEHGRLSRPAADRRRIRRRLFACSSASDKLVRLPLLRRSRRLHTAADRISAHKTTSGRRSGIVAGAYLLGCWTTRAAGSVLLLSALGLRLLADDRRSSCCASARPRASFRSRPAVRSRTSGDRGGFCSRSASAGSFAINFSLASGLLLVTSASAAAVAGVSASVAPA